MSCTYIFKDEQGNEKQLGENAFKAWLATGDNLAFLRGEQATQSDSAEKGNADNKDGSDAVAFSRAKDDQDASLYVAHNLSIDNMRHVLDIGGLAAPSLATLRIDKGVFTGFGEITLLASKEILESKKARTLDADAYSPRHPKPVYAVKQEALDALKKRMGETYGMRTGLDDLENGAYGLLYSDAIKFMWLKERGDTVTLPKTQTDIRIKKLAEFASPNRAIEEGGEAAKLAVAYYKSQAKKLNDAYKGKEESFDANQYYFEEDGSLKQSAIRDIAHQARRFNETKGIDFSKLAESVNKKLQNPKVMQDYKDFALELFNGLVTNPRIFKGFTNSGNRKYIPYTMDNIIKEMTTGLRNAEGFNYGAGNIRSAFANELKNIKSVQAQRDRIVSGEEMERIKSESRNKLNELLDELLPHYKYDQSSYRYLDDASSAIAEGSRAMRETFNMTPELSKKVSDYVQYLRYLPTDYFETKLQRAVDLKEFNAAIVPSGTPNHIIEALESNGLKVRKYKDGDNESRMNAVKKEAILFSRAAPFYSQLTRAFMDAKTGKQSGNQWAQWLNGNAPKFGIKADEMQWSGVLNYLELRGTDKVTKEDILDYLSGNGVVVNDVVKTSGVMPDGWTLEQDRYGLWTVNNERGVPVTTPQRSRDQALEVVPQNGDTKFSGYWKASYKDGIPGTYREILVTLPDAMAKIREHNAPISKRIYELFGAANWELAELGLTREQANAEIARLNAEKKTGELPFTSQHWDEKNVLVHIRLDEVMGDDGKRYVRVGEVQSDWHQMRTQGKEVPNAPFSDTRAWVSLGIKRAIQHAISVDADGVIFGTGQQNADLYDLSKQVNMVKAIPVTGGFDLFFEDSAGKQHDVGVKSRDELTDVVGKEMADKIVTDNGGTYRGVDLKVGGEGMLVFYNSIVPSVARDVLKKAKIGTVESIAAAGETHRGFALDTAVRERVNADGLPLFQKPKGTGKGMTIAEVTAAIMPTRKLWKNAPPIVIVDNINHKDVPEAIRAEDAAQRAKGATGSVAGVFHGGKVYLVADQITSAQDAVTVLFHESLGHYGLRGVFGDELGVVLNQVMLSHNKAFMDKAKNYGYATSIEQAREKVQAYLDRKGLAKPSNFEELAKAKLKKDRDGAAEEVLAELAQAKPELNLVQKAIAAIKTFLRKIGLLDQSNMTDNEIIKNFILPARGFVERGERMKNDGGVSFQRVFHGSPHRFDKFDSAHMGKGEGNQAYGAGHYFASAKAVAEHYRNALSKPVRTYNGNAVDAHFYPNEIAALFADDIIQNTETKASAIAAIDDEISTEDSASEKQKLERARAFIASLDFAKFGTQKGQLYEVEIPEDDAMLLWDKPLSEQPVKVRDVIEKMLPGVPERLTGEQIYNAIGGKGKFKTPSERAKYQSLSLSDAGIRGIKYLDGTSRSDGEGSYNYVIFDDADISIEKTHFSRAENEGSVFSQRESSTPIISKNSTAWKEHKQESDMIEWFSSDEVTYTRSNSKRTGFFYLGDTLIRKMDIPHSYAPSSKQDALSALKKINDDKLENKASKLSEQRERAKFSSEKNAIIKKNLAFIHDAMNEYSDVISSAHTNSTLNFKLLDAGKFAAKDTVLVYKSPNYGKKKGSEYRIILVDGKPAYARESDHWGEFHTNDWVDGEVVSKIHNWNLEGYQQKTWGGDRFAGYIFIDDLENNRFSFARDKKSSEADQFTDTERAYGGREAYDKAKAAGKTKLNYQQWIQVRTPAFKAWFGDSKVVDAETGEPMVVYHGTNADFAEFMYTGKQKTRGSQTHWMGFFFANNPEFANRFTRGGNDGANIVPAFLSIKNMYKVSYEEAEEYDSNTAEQNDIAAQSIAENGHDGLLISLGERKHDEIVAFNPNQVKSAIGNNGDFSLDNNDIRFSRSAMSPSEVKAVVDNIKSMWTNAPRVIVVDSIQDDRAPKAVRRDNARLMALGAHGRPEGFMHNGDVYLVADALPNVKRVGEVFLHEVVGHYGLNGAFGEVLTSVLDRVANARGTEVEAKAKKYGLATDMQSAMKAERVSAEKSGEDISGLSAMQLRERAKTRLRQDTLTAAEEVLAEMTETNPRAGFVRMAIASIRTFLREIGLLNSAAMTDDEIIQQFIVPARRYVERVASVKDGRSRDAKAWKQSAAEIAHDGELFAYDRTISKNMADSLRVIAPGADILAVQKAGGDARYILSLPNGNEATITTRTRRLGRDDGRYGLDGGNDIAGQNSTAIAKDAMEVFLDVSKVGNGNGGSMIYAVAADHAANNGGILIGDPSGLSNDGLARRAENMLSSALKYGTTKHLAPHPRQIEGDFTGIGVIPLQWTHGDDAGNTLSLMNVVVSRIEVMSPTIMSEYGYDTERRTFIDTKTGKPVSSKRLFEDVDKRWENGDWHGDTPVGSRTLARGLLFKSLVQRASAEDDASGGKFADRLLDQLASLATDAESQTWKIFYSRRPDGRDGLAEAGEIGNNGDFSLDNNDIRFSRSAQQTVQQSQAVQQQSILSNTKDWLAGKTDDVMPAALGVLTLKHLADVSSKVLPQINDYVKLTDKMQADRNGMMNESGEIITDWQDWAGENRKMQETLADLMSRSTISGQHPGKDYAPINIQKANRELAKAQDELLRATTPEAKRVLNEQIKETKELIDYETSGKRKAEYDDMRKVWDTQLNDKAREIYENVRKHYEKRAHDTYQTLVDRINNSAMSGKAAMLEKMRKEYEGRRVHGVYFPLARQGDYWLNATDPNGERVFMMFDTSKELKQAQRAVASGGFTEITSGRKVDNESNAGMNAGFVLDVMNTIGNNVSDDTVSAAMRDEVYQLFLKTMPDMSMRKALIHRKKVAGYSNDVIRGFAIRSQHMAHQISRMRVSQQLQQFMTDMRKDAKDNPSVQKSALLNEMQKRHQWVMNPQDSSWANKLTGLGFLWYLGASPAAAAVNLTQLGVTTLPVLAAKHGFIKSQTELTKAMSAAFGKGMNAAEQAMLKALEGAGVIETTMAHDVAGIGSTGTEGYNPLWNKTIGGVAWMFHQAEVFNRKTTALAAYRLALSQPGTTNEQAIEYAQNVIWESHFDYGNINRSRYMQPNIAKVLFLFKQYALNVSYYLLRNAYKAVAGETKQVRDEAMIKLGGTMAVTFTLAGVSGLPMFGMIAGLVGAVMAMGGGDDDEPFKLETAMYAWIKKEYGADIANLVMNGPTNAVTGVDFASRTSMGDLWLRSPDRELEGKALAHHYLEQLAGPVAGIPISFMAGLQLMQDGHMERGFEKMVPKAARDLLQANRFHNEGALNLRDAPLVEKDDITLFDVIMRGNGFTPAKLAEVYDSNSRVTNVQTFLHDRRQTLINRAWLAKSSGDDDAWAKNMENVRDWNAKYPKDKITIATLHKSFKSRDKAKSGMESGVIVKDKYRDVIDAVR